MGGFCVGRVEINGRYDTKLFKKPNFIRVQFVWIVYKSENYICNELHDNQIILKIHQNLINFGILIKICCTLLYFFILSIQ